MDQEGHEKPNSMPKCMALVGITRTSPCPLLMIGASVLIPLQKQIKPGSLCWPWRCSIDQSHLAETPFLFSQEQRDCRALTGKHFLDAQDSFVGERGQVGASSWCSALCRNRQKNFRGNCFWPFFEINVTITGSLRMYKSRSELLGDCTHCDTFVGWE